MLKQQYSAKNVVFSAVLAFLASFAFSVQNATYKIPDNLTEIRSSKILRLMYQLEHSISMPNIYLFALTVLLFIGIYYILSRGVDKRILPYAIPFSLIGSAFVLLCKSYYKFNSWEQVLGSSSAIMTSAVKGLGIAVLLFFLYIIVSKINIIPDESKQMKRSPFKQWIAITALLFALWLPYTIIMLPGSMNPDVKDQIAQILNQPNYCWTEKAVIFKHGEGLLNNYHPVFHTGVLALFLKIGEIIGSYKLGFALMCVVQNLAMSGTLALSVVYLRRKLRISDRYYKLLVLFFALNPLLPLWSTTLTKDPLFIIGMVLCTVLIFDCFKFPEEFKAKKFVCLAAALFYLMISRNNGMYLVLLLIPFAIIHFRKDKKFLLKAVSVLLIPIILFKVGYTGIFFDKANIAETSVREMLSIPIQQTARYVSEYGEDVSPEEEAAILKVLSGANGEESSLQLIADKYVPYLSDSVKNMYNKNATTDDLINYLKAWGKGLLKHPDSYIQAFLNMNYGWFGMDSRRDNIYYNYIDPEIEKMVEDISFPKALTEARTFVNEGVRILDKLPVTSVLFEFSAYTWGFVIIFLTLLKRKKFTELLAFLPIYFNYAICFVGPVAYIRYAIPMIACFPFVFTIAFMAKNEEKAEGEISQGESLDKSN